MCSGNGVNETEIELVSGRKRIWFKTCGVCEMFMWSQSYIRTEAEVLILWPPDVKSQLIGKDHDAGKD